jgi:hypothetical protein
MPDFATWGTTGGPGGTLFWSREYLAHFGKMYNDLASIEAQGALRCVLWGTDVGSLSSGMRGSRADGLG